MELNIKREAGAAISKDFIGLFIEDINYAVDGGLYAEMLENRNFESMEAFGGKDQDYYTVYDGLYAWSIWQEASGIRAQIVMGSPVNEANPHYLRLTSETEGCGIANKAYDGVYMKPGLSYHISFYARAAEYHGSMKVMIVKDGRIIAEQRLSVHEADETGWRRWEKYQLELSCDEEVRGGQFVLLLEQTGTMEFDFFSMMPEDAVCGVFRKDLVEMLQALKPAFLRFPGGCIVEGATLSNRYRFRNTIGEPESRKYNWNRWALHGNDEKNGYHSLYAHYGQTYGIGFYEYFLLCEYIGAKPLPVLGVGLACQYQSHEKVEPENTKIQEYIQDYLDLIAFANGPADSKMGSLRAAMGHEEPFHLTMIGVGNEQWEDKESRFFERYTLFEQEIHKVYPQIRLIGTAGPELGSDRYEAAWDFYLKNEEKPGFVYAVDEHYYTSPEWFLNHTDYYDKTPRKTKVFLGEYAAHPFGWMTMNHPEGNNLEGALAEAAFLTGAARNSDAVVMTCYAPLFARLSYAQWNPNLIWFDEARAYATPNYYVQQIFSVHAGDYNIKAEGDGLPYQVSYDEKAQNLIVKLINASDKNVQVKLILEDGWNTGSGSAKQILLTAAEPHAYNTIEKETVKPESKEVRISNGNYTVPKYTFAVLLIPAVKD